MIKQGRFANGQTGEAWDAGSKHIDVFNDDGFLLRSKQYNRKQFFDICLSDVVGKGKDFKRVHILGENLYEETNVIMVMESTRKALIADIEDISNMIGLNPRSTREFMARMAKAHVIGKKVDKVNKVGNIVTEMFLLNPLFFYVERLTPDLYFLFKESLDCYLSPYAKRKFHLWISVSNISKIMCIDMRLRRSED